MARMRPEQLQVVLRPRSRWEAVELGTALVRRHAGAVWRAWLLAGVPVFVLLNALCWWLDRLWLAGVLMWWLLPLCDRAVLYVLSRAVFGQVPGVRETLAVVPGFGRGERAAHLLWRRLSPWRVLELPVDGLEGGTTRVRRARRDLLMQGQGMACALLAWLCGGAALLLALALISLVLVFVPGEFLPDTARALWAMLTTDPPHWVQAALNAALWCGMSVIEPFHIGAGFGLYLNRRVQLEGWDIELALRGLRARLRRDGSGGSVRVVALLCVPLLALAWLPSAAVQDSAAVPAANSNSHTVAEVFPAAGQRTDADAAFLRTVAAAGNDALLHPYRTEQVWIPRLGNDEETMPDGSPETPGARPSMPVRAQQVLALMGEVLLWLAAAALLLALVVSAPRWWPWMRERARRTRMPEPIRVQASTEPAGAALPVRIAASARVLWHTGNRRQALGLLYRGSLATLGGHLGAAVAAGTSEAECLRLSHGLPEADARAAFAQVVAVWQQAAYAGRLPDDAHFTALADTLARRFGWRP